MIPFPKMHIAESVLNRINNALNDAPPTALVITPPPITPDPMMQGAAIDNALSQPAQPAGLPPGVAQDAEAGVLDAAATGGSPLAGIIAGGGLGV